MQQPNPKDYAEDNSSDSLEGESGEDTPDINNLGEEEIGQDIPEVNKDINSENQEIRENTSKVENDIKPGNQDVTVLELSQWLSAVRLEKYSKKFEEQQYTMEKIIEFNQSQVEAMIKAVGAKPGAAVKIRQGLNVIHNINKWKEVLCGTWTNDLKDKISISLNDTRALVVSMQLSGCQMLTGTIAICKNHFFLHYDDYPGVFGQLKKEDTSKSNCAILVWVHQDKDIKWYATNKEIEGVEKWLSSLGLQRYLPRFQHHQYNSMNLIKSLDKSQIDKMLDVVECRRGASLKILFDLELLEKKDRKIVDPYMSHAWRDEPDRMIDYEKKGGKSFDSGDMPQATFWFFQHKMHKLRGADYSNFDLASSNCLVNWLGFSEFLEQQLFESKIRSGTSWQKVQELWDKKTGYLGGMTEVFEWLLSMGLENCARYFEAAGYDSMELISVLHDPQITEMLKLTGCNETAGKMIRDSLQHWGTQKRKKWVHFDPYTKLKLKKGDNATLQKNQDRERYESYDPKSQRKQKTPEEIEEEKKKREEENKKWEETRIKKGRAVHDWLYSMNLHKKGPEFWDNGYQTMDKIRSLNKREVERMFRLTKCDEEASSTIIRSLDTLPAMGGQFRIGHKSGIEVLKEAVYPGECVGYRLDYGDVSKFSETKKIRPSGILNYIL